MRFDLSERDRAGGLDVSVSRLQRLGLCVVVVANGSCGLAVSFLLRYADSIAKTYATALSIPATSLASYLSAFRRRSAPRTCSGGPLRASW